MEKISKVLTGIASPRSVWLTLGGWKDETASGSGGGSRVREGWSGALGCLICLLLTSTIGIRSASGGPDALLESWRWIHFSLEDGLPSNRIIGICETRQGVIWVSTTSGLAWYDEFRWNRVSGDSPPPPKPAFTLVPDLEKGILTVIEGRLYRGDRNDLHRVSVSHDHVELIVRNAIPTFDGGLIILGRHPTRPEKYLLRMTSHGGMEPYEIPGDLSANDLYDIWGTSEDEFWLHAKHGLYCRVQGRWNLDLETNAPSGVLKLLVKHEEEGYVAINHSYLGRGLWAWTEDEAPHVVLDENKGRIDALSVSPDGTVLVVYDSGLVHIKEAHVWSELKLVPFELTGVRSMIHRANGDLLVGSDRGLFLHRIRHPVWSHWKNHEAVGEDRINEFLRASDGSLWIATRNGVERRASNGRLERFVDVIGQSLRNSTGLGEDVHGNIWVTSGSAYEGAFRYDGKNWTHIGEPEGLPGLRHKIRKDRQGRLWFLGLGNIGQNLMRHGHGAAVYDQGRFEHWTVERGLLHDRVYSFVEGREGELWFGTIAGICRFKDGQWTYWNEDNGLALNRIWSLAVDEANTLWFADQQLGLGRIIDGRPVYQTVENGVPDNEIQDIQADPKGGMWIVYIGGVARYFQGRWFVFRTWDGIGHANLWPILPEEDHIYVGTQGKGTAILNRKALEEAELRIDMFETVLNDHSVAFNWRATSRNAVIASEEIETRFQLNTGRWSDWLVNTRTSMALPPGRHALRVQARSRTAVAPFAEAQTELTLPYPIYRHPIVLSVTGGLVGLAGALFVFMFMRQRRQNVLLREQSDQLQSIAERVPGLVYSYDITPEKKRKLLYLGPGLTELIGPNAAAKVKARCDSVIDMIHPDDREHLFRLSAQRLEQYLPVDCELRLMSDSGEYVWIRTISQPLDMGQGVTRWHGVVVDITETKKYEKALRHNESTIRELYAVTASVNLSRAERIEKLLELGCKCFDLEIGTVGQIEGERYTVISCIAPEPFGLEPGLEFDLGQTFCRQTMLSDRPVAEHHIRHSPLAEHPAYRQFQIEAYLGVPIIVRTQVFGTLSFSSRSPRANPFTGPDQDLLRLMAQWVGTEIERSNTHDELKWAYDNLEQQVQERTLNLRETNQELKWQIVEREMAEAELQKKHDQERLLFSELDHRVRNNLASLISLLDITQQESGNLKTFKESIRGRIEAMAAVHTVLSVSRWTTTSLRSFIHVLTPPGTDGVLELSGDDVEISARQANAFGMVIHELLNNSLKYGALSHPGGIVRFSWTTDGVADEGCRLECTWSETGGPTIHLPATPGAGISIISGLIKFELKGSITFTFPPQGAQHRFEILLDRMSDLERIQREVVFGENHDLPTEM